MSFPRKRPLAGANFLFTYMLNRQQYLIREQIGLLKVSDVYDIVDPISQQKLGEAREELSGLVKFCRLFLNKQLMPTKIAVYQGTDPASQKLLFTLRRGVALFRPKVEVKEASGVTVGYLQSKLLSLGGAFRVFTSDGKEIARVEGNWIGWEFKFLSGSTELGRVTKQWTGLAKELFTSADNYMIEIVGEPERMMNLLLLAAGLAIDIVFKESK